MSRIRPWALLREDQPRVGAMLRVPATAFRKASRRAGWLPRLGRRILCPLIIFD